MDALASRSRDDPAEARNDFVTAAPRLATAPGAGGQV